MFKDSCIVSCGILHPEMKYLMDTGFVTCILDPNLNKLE